MFQITKQVKLIEKKEFVIGVLDSEHKVFLVYVAALSMDSDDKIYPLKRAQIAYLKVDKAFIEVFSKYANFTNIFLSKLAIKLFDHIEINDYAIE